jgi:hypothetical protein
MSLPGAFAHCPGVTLSDAGVKENARADPPICAGVSSMPIMRQTAQFWGILCVREPGGRGIAGYIRG